MDNDSILYTFKNVTRCLKLCCFNCQFTFRFLQYQQNISVLMSNMMWIERLEKKLDGNYTRMLRAILNKSWQQHPTRHQRYGHPPNITKTIQVRRTRHAGHCWRSKDELISDVLLWTPAYGQAKAGRPARTYIQQLCEDTGCSPKDMPAAWHDDDGRVSQNKCNPLIW